MGRCVTHLTLLVLVIGLTMFGDLASAGPSPTPIRLPVAPAGSPDTAVVVEKGDHLWRISEIHLGTVYNREATDREVAPYWREVITENQATLRSGDPDLIYPGEVISLPPASP